jgi:hypothetical protein
VKRGFDVVGIKAITGIIEEIREIHNPSSTVQKVKTLVLNDL